MSTGLNQTGTKVTGKESTPWNADYLTDIYTNAKDLYGTTDTTGIKDVYSGYSS